MNILINCSTCRVGGGIQVSASLISHSAFASNHSYFYCVSPQVAEALSDAHCHLDSRRFVIADVNPYLLISGRFQKNLLSLVSKWNIDIVFTVFGPSYVRFPVPHVCGYARPWDLHPTLLAYRQVSFVVALRIYISSIIRLRMLPKTDFYWTETEYARIALASRCSIPLSKIKVVPNTCSAAFRGNYLPGPVPNCPPFRILTIASPYPHKRLNTIPYVARHMLELGWERSQLEFVVTIPWQSHYYSTFVRHCNDLGVSQMIVNVGVVGHSECLKLYSSSACVFLPTCLEVFSVSHVEAMAMGVPIVTSNIKFVREVCRDAALYYEPSSAESAAEAITRVLGDVSLRQGLVRAGASVLERLPDSFGKFQMHVDWLETVYSMAAPSRLR